MVFNNSVDLLTTEEWLQIEVNEFLASPERKLMLTGEQYYKGENDILNRKMYRYENEEKVEDRTKTNNKLVHSFMHSLVDDKVNYLLTKPYTLSCKDDGYLKSVQDLLGKRFQKKLGRLGTESSNKGIAWLHPYINSKGEFKTMLIPSEQCIPIWKDNDHEDLDGLIRVYEVEMYEGKSKKYVTKVEYHRPDGVTYYVMSENTLILDAEMYLDVADNVDDEVGHFEVNGEQQSWERVPFIPFKNNDFELPDLNFVKSLIDNYDLTRSDVANLLEDVKNIVYALRGYGGESLSDFMRDLAYYRAIILDDDGGLDKVETTINIEAAKAHFEQLKKDIFDFGQGVDKNSDKLGNSPSGIALKFIYSGLDLKCNGLEDWFKWSFEQLIYFVNKYFEVTGQGTSSEEIEIVFNRDIAINESQAIEDCQNSEGIISARTIRENHPWVTDADEEEAQLEKELAKKIEEGYQESFGSNKDGDLNGQEE